MELKKKSLRLGQVLRLPFMALGLLLFCGILSANVPTPQQIAKKALAATVLLVMEDANGELLGYGSGFFVRSNQIATNFHVIDGAAQGTAKRVGQETEYTIEGVTALDENHDLAILQVSSSGVQPLLLGDSDTVEIGDAIYVAGNPKGYFEGTFSDGIISAIRGDSASKRLQMTAPVSSGSSGGPVLNSSGEVIGVSFATFRGGQNLNFAIPSNYLKEMLAQMGTAKPLSEGKQSTPAETYFLRGWVKDELGDYKGAIADYDVAIQLNPNDADAYLNRGVAKNKLGQYFAAITDFDTAIRLKPDYADAYYNRGVAKDKLGQHTAATADYDAALQIKPDLAQDYLSRGNVKHQLGLYQSAITDFDNAIRLKPNYVDAYYSRGNAQVGLGQHNAAISDYDTAIRIKSKYAEAYLNRGIAREQLGQHNDAFNDFDTAIQLKPNIASRLKHSYAETYYERGNAKVESGQYNAAIKDYDTAIRIKPDYVEALYNRGVAKDKLGQHNDAFNDFNIAIEFTPHNLKDYYYGKYYQNSGFVKKALNATVFLNMVYANDRPILGNGFFVQPNLIATDFDLIRSAARGTAKLVGHKTEYTIKNFTAMSGKGLAILQVSGSKIQPLPLGDSNTIRIGDPVYVACNSKGSKGLFLRGYISETIGSFTSQRFRMSLSPTIRGYPYLSAGSPVLNGRGEVIGVSLTTFSSRRIYYTAIPSNYLKALLAQLEPAQSSSKGKSSISAETYFRRGNAKYESGLYRSAIANYDSAIQVKPNYAKAYYNRGKAKNSLGRTEEAKQDFQTALKLAEQSGDNRLKTVIKVRIQGLD